MFTPISNSLEGICMRGVMGQNVALLSEGWTGL